MAEVKTETETTTRITLNYMNEPEIRFIHDVGEDSISVYIKRGEHKYTHIAMFDTSEKDQLIVWLQSLQADKP